eukprot:3923050-Pyramimonas_sp.AAC.1
MAHVLRRRILLHGAASDVLHAKIQQYACAPKCIARPMCTATPQIYCTTSLAPPPCRWTPLWVNPNETCGRA